MSAIEAFQNARAAHEQATQQAIAARDKAIVAEVREILRKEYDAAKLALPIFEGAIPEYRAFIESIGSPPTQQVAQWCNNIKRLCDAIPRQMRTAIDAYETLRAEHIPDNHQREVFIRVTRAWLKSHDGALESLAFSRKQIEAWFLAWGQSDAAPRPMMVSVPATGLEIGAFVKKEAP